MSGKASSVDEDFLPWLERKAGAEITCTVSIGESPHGGRGLFASENIKKGDPILRVPHSVQLGRNNLPSEIKSLLENNIDPFSAVAVLLLRLKNDSEWAPYISRLPLPQDLHSSVLWSNEELEMIRPSCLFETTLRRKEQIKKDFLFVKFVLQDTTTTTLEEFTYAYQLVKSRAWISNRGVILIPFADFLNHDTRSTANLVENELGQHSEIIADRDYAAGDEVFISYGNYSNATLLLSYGFTVPDNPYDFDRLSLSSMAQHGKDLGSIKIKSMEDISPSLRAFARSLVPRFRQDIIVEDKEIEIAANQLLHDEISKLLVAKRDEHMMKLLLESSSACVEVRRQLALQLLDGEVRVLKSALSRLEEYSSTLPTNS